jgi:hypothetical protein
MNNKTFDKYFITYSNYFEFNGVKLAFRKELTHNIPPEFNDLITNNFWDLV